MSDTNIIENNMVDIFYEESPGKWKKDSYNRTTILDQLLPDYENTLTLWGDSTENQRVKMVGKISQNEYPNKKISSLPSNDSQPIISQNEQPLQCFDIC